MAQPSSWQPAQEQIRFEDLDFQERVEALTAGANNIMGKILTLMAMKSGIPYTIGDLIGSVEVLYGGKPPFSSKLPFNYCKYSLSRIGAVVAGVVNRKGRRVYAFARTEAAGRYSLPIAAKTLDFCAKNDIPLGKLFGSAQSGGDVRRGYVAATVLILLAFGGPDISTKHDIGRLAGIPESTVKAAIQSLDAVGLVKYESIPKDVFLESDHHDWAKATLCDIAKARQLAARLRNGVISDFQQTGLHRRNAHTLYLSAAKLENVLRDPQQELDYSKLSTLYEIKNRQLGSSIIAALCQLGVYEYSKFSWKQRSSITLTELGRSAVAEVFLPVIEVSSHPACADDPAFGLEYARLGTSGMLQLLRKEEHNFVAEKIDRTKVQSMPALQLLNYLRCKFGDRPFRTMDARTFFPDMSVGGVNNYLRYLCRTGNIEKTTVTVQTHLGAKTMPNGFYRISQGEKSTSKA